MPPRVTDTDAAALPRKADVGRAAAAYRRALENAGVSPEDLTMLRRLADANRELNGSETAPPLTRVFL